MRCFVERTFALQLASTGLASWVHTLWVSGELRQGSGCTQPSSPEQRVGTAGRPQLIVAHVPAHTHVPLTSEELQESRPRVSRVSGSTGPRGQGQRVTPRPRQTGVPSSAPSEGSGTRGSNVISRRKP